jgi:hypothetical protein
MNEGKWKTELSTLSSVSTQTVDKSDVLDRMYHPEELRTTAQRYADVAYQRAIE